MHVQVQVHVFINLMSVGRGLKYLQLGYSNHPLCACMCVFYHLISETTCSCYQYKLSMDRTGYEREYLQAIKILI